MFSSSEVTTSVDSVVVQSEKENEIVLETSTNSSQITIESSTLCNGVPSQFMANTSSSKTVDLVSSFGKNLNLNDKDDIVTTAQETVLEEEPLYKKYNPISNERINPFDKNIIKTSSPAIPVIPAVVPIKEDKTLDDLTKDRFNKQQEIIKDPISDSINKKIPLPVTTSESVVASSQSKREEFGKTRKK